MDGGRFETGLFMRDVPLLVYRDRRDHLRDFLEDPWLVRDIAQVVEQVTSQVDHPSTIPIAHLRWRWFDRNRQQDLMYHMMMSFLETRYCFDLEERLTMISEHAFSHVSRMVLPTDMQFRSFTVTFNNRREVPESPITE